MRDKLLLVGAGGLGRVTLEHASPTFDCAFVDDGYSIGTEICGVPVVGAIQDLSRLRKEYTSLVVTIGDNPLREQIYRQAEELGFAFPNVVAHSAYVSPFARLGWGCILLNNAVVQNGAQIGNGVVLTTGVEAHHDCTISDFALVYTNSVVRTGAKIGERAKIGSTATVGNFVQVPEDAVIPDGAAIQLSSEEVNL